MKKILIFSTIVGVFFILTSVAVFAAGLQSARSNDNQFTAVIVPEGTVMFISDGNEPGENTSISNSLEVVDVTTEFITAGEVTLQNIYGEEIIVRTNFIGNASRNWWFNVINKDTGVLMHQGFLPDFNKGDNSFRLGAGESITLVYKIKTVHPVYDSNPADDKQVNFDLEFEPLFY